ncbi:hypothetical protein F6A46_05425 [Tenacibaculum finnmarkense genomovar ulcerans]|uniref:insulinase family protein n=1 Tax=Tenacibaculum finnmarkense TaxID=2781243 RepID=UPI00187B5B3C|nr:M16 family metallopeptidase [Tenacibaculum finnmarkense]MBE7687679.1 hypothetical protein [Tenacibaculum finnmarkense genomovar ulcerans]
MNTSSQLAKLLLIFIEVFIFLCFSGIKTHAFQKKESILLSNKLKNGMEYTIQKNKNVNETLFYFLVKTGSINETDKQLGYAHFLEHMAFNGGKRFINDSFVQFLKSEGLQIGVNFNATTNYNYTLYEINFPKVVSATTIKKTLHFFADILNDLSLNKKDIYTQQKIVLAEKEAAVKADSLFLFKLGQSRYLKRLAIGTSKSINEITSKKLNEFYKKWYQPHASSLFIIGDIPINKTKKAIETTFSNIKNTHKNSVSKNFFKDLNTTATLNISEKIKKPQLIITLAEKHTPQSKKEAQVKNILTKVISKRLDTILSLKTSPIVRSNYFLGDVHYTSVQCNLTSTPLIVLTKVFTELKRLALYGITNEDLKNYLKKDITKRVSKTNNFYANEWFDIQLGIKKKSLISTKEITPTTIKEVAKKLWETSIKRVYITDSLKKKKSIATKDLKNIITKVNQLLLKNYSYKAPIKKSKKQKKTPILKTGKLFPKSPVRKKEHKNLGILEVEYKNGVKVFLKPINTTTDETRILGFTNKGTSNIPDDLYYQLESTVSYMDLGGIGNLNYEKLEAFMEHKKMGASQIITEKSSAIYSFSAPKDLNHFFKFLYLKMTAARANKKEFESIITDEIRNLSSVEESPFAIKSDFKIAELSGMYYPNRKSAATKKEFKKLDISQMKNWYNSCFAFANNWQFIVTGNFKNEKILPLINTYFGNLKRNPKSIKNKSLFKLKTTDSTYTYNKKSTTTNTDVTQIYYLPYKANLKNSLLLSLSERMLRDKITILLRENLGFVYTPFVNIEKDILNQQAILKINWQCNPSVLKRSKDKLKKLLKTKFSLTKSDLKNYKQQLKLKYQSVINSNNTHIWGGSLHEILSEKITIEELNSYNKILKGLRAKDISDFIELYFNEVRKNTVEVIVK